MDQAEATKLEKPSVFLRNNYETRKASERGGRSESSSVELLEPKAQKLHAEQRVREQKAHVDFNQSSDVRSVLSKKDLEKIWQKHFRCKPPKNMRANQ